MAKIFTIRAVFRNLSDVTLAVLIILFFLVIIGSFYEFFHPDHMLTSSRFSMLVYRRANGVHCKSLGPQLRYRRQTRLVQKISSRLFCTNTLTVASLTSPTMRRDYYRGSQDSLTAAHLDDRRCSGPLYRGGSLRGMHYTHSLTALIQYTSANFFILF